MKLDIEARKPRTLKFRNGFIGCRGRTSDEITRRFVWRYFQSVITGGNFTEHAVKFGELRSYLNDGGRRGSCLKGLTKSDSQPSGGVGSGEILSPIKILTCGR